MNIKLDMFIIGSKGFAYVTIGFCGPMGAGIAQWANSGETPSMIMWAGLTLGSIVGGATQWLAFCSSSWNTYRQQQKADNTGETQTVTVEPAPDKK